MGWCCDSAKLLVYQQTHLCTKRLQNADTSHGLRTTLAFRFSGNPKNESRAAFEVKQASLVASLSFVLGLQTLEKFEDVLACRLRLLATVGSKGLVCLDGLDEAATSSFHLLPPESIDIVAPLTLQLLRLLPLLLSLLRLLGAGADEVGYCGEQCPAGGYDVDHEDPDKEREHECHEDAYV